MVHDLRVEKNAFGNPPGAPPQEGEESVVKEYGCTAEELKDEGTATVLRLEMLDHLEEIFAPSFVARWHALLECAGNPEVFLTPTWQHAFWGVIGIDAGEQPCFLALYDESDELLALAPFSRCIDGKGRAALIFSGGREVSDYQDILYHREAGQEVFGILAEVLAQRAANGEVLHLHNLPEDSITTSELLPLLAERGLSVVQEREWLCPIIELADSWEAFLHTLSSKDRHELRRKMRKAEREGDLEWVRYSEAHCLEEAMGIFMRLMRLSQPEKEVFLDRRTEEFFRRVAHGAFEHGWLALSVLNMRGEPAAAIWCFDYDGRRLCYNSGLDPEKMKLAPGIVLTGYTVAESIERGCRVYDFLRGDERYKYRFGARDRYLCRVDIESLHTV